MAKRAAKKTAGQRRATKKPIESYDHKDKKRTNNPPVGLVTPDTDPDHGKKKTYEYDPHLDPQLVWAGKGVKDTVNSLRGSKRCVLCGDPIGRRLSVTSMLNCWNHMDYLNAAAAAYHWEASPVSGYFWKPSTQKLAGRKTKPFAC